MSWLHSFFFRFRSLFTKKRIETDLAEEIQLHLQLQIEANLAAGMSAEEARLAARREFGGVTQITERYREARGFGWLEQFVVDGRFAVRSLLRARGFTLTVLLITALCLAANTVIFSIVDRAMLKPLPFRDAGRLVTVHNNYPKAGLIRVGVSVPHYYERKELPVFVEAGGLRGTTVTLNSNDAPEPIAAASATPSFFRMLGINAALGRTFTDDEAISGHDKFVLLSQEFWRDHFNSAPSVIGQTLRIADAPYIIVGVLPRDFHYLSYTAKLWLPLSFSAEDRGNDRRHGAFIEMVARLRPGATLAEAQSQIDALDQRALKIDYFAPMAISAGFHTTVDDLHSDHVRTLRPVLLLLQIGVLFLLLIGAVNLANLFMVRATSRTKEYSLRQVLGASRLRLIALVLIESILLTLFGGMLGIGLGAIGLKGIHIVMGDRLPVDFLPRLDFTVSSVALGIAVILGFLLALPVIWLTARRNLGESLMVESRGGTTTRSVHRFRHGLIVAQIALAFTLLSGAGLLGLSLVRALEVNPGFSRENLLTSVVILPADEYKESPQRQAVAQRLLSSARSVPGTRFAAISRSVPFSARSWVAAWSIAGATLASDEFIKEGMYDNAISPDYFSTLGIPLREGRIFTNDDLQMKRPVCIVDEDFAHRHWPKGGALGQRLTLPDDAMHPDPKREYHTIVGVVGTVKQKDLTDPSAHGDLYFPFVDDASFVVTLRTAQDPEAAASSLRVSLQKIDPRLKLVDVKTMNARLEQSLADRRTPFLLVGIFASVSLILAAVGIYSVLAYSVTQRRREIGVRMALGAQPGQILWQFLSLGLSLLGVGLPLGVVGAWLGGRAMADQLFGVTPASPIVLSGTATLLAIVAMAACLLPSRRAARVSPSEALRSE